MSKRSFAKLGYIAVTIEKRAREHGKSHYLRWYDANGKRCLQAVGHDSAYAEITRRKIENELNAPPVAAPPAPAALPVSQPAAAPAGPVRRRATFADFKRMFLEAEANSRKRTMESYLHVLRMFMRDCPGLTYLDEVDGFQVDRYRQTRLDHAAPTTVNRDCAHMRALFNRAIRWGLVDHNPFKGLRRFKEGDHVIETITPAEEDRLLRAIAQNTSPRYSDLYKQKMTCIVKVAIEAALRNAEIRGLKWQDICLKTGKITLVSRPDWPTKSGKGRTVFVSMPTVALLQDYRARTEGRADERPFYYAGSAVLGHIFAALAKKVNIKCGMHTLRRTSISRMASAGVSSEVLTAFAGHEDIRVTLTYYTKFDERSLHDAMQAGVRRGREGRALKPVQEPTVSLLDTVLDTV
ncbi:MAG: site-specific integrase [Planctomycetota bacterium]